MPKKSFADSAMSFISKPSKPQEMQKPAEETIQPVDPGQPQERPNKPIARSSQAPVGYKVNPAYIEKKSQRLQLLIQPSLYMALKEKAQADHTSVNDLISQLLKQGLNINEEA